ncbi:hypothetical protein Taro_032959 [Colocasia esculenta]|uniref:50S ribosomal protein 5, chloroplastic n=1 Tax=Colocasia esculenta TaxID=4460 RepID=A0A843W7N3_COLES|nr:hypothetical protein [Colocasia esculenta]
MAAALLLPPLSSVSPPLSSSATRSPPLCGLLLPTPSPPSSANRCKFPAKMISIFVPLMLCNSGFLRLGLLLPISWDPLGSLFLSFQTVQRILRSGSLNGLTPTVPCSISGKRKLITHASSATDGTDSSNADAPKEGEEDSASVESLPLETKLQLKLEQKLKMKLAKKIRLRRKRLVRKRMMRKKGRWPPSKMKKNKNV